MAMPNPKANVPDTMSGTEELRQLAGETRWIELAPLLIDESYQREEKSHYKRIAKNFKPEACGALAVAEREDGGRYVVDGQQRRLALLHMGLPCWFAKIIKSSGPRYEANLFILLNGGQGTVVSVNLREKYKGSLVAGDPLCTLLERVLQQHGFKVQAGGHNWPAIQCVGTLLAIVRANEQTLSDTLTTIRAVWEGDSMALKSSVIGGIAMVLEVPKLKRDRLVEVLRPLPAHRLVQVANGQGARSGLSNGLAPSTFRSGGAVKVAIEIMRLYNSKLRSGRLKLFDDPEAS